MCNGVIIKKRIWFVIAIMAVLLLLTGCQGEDVVDHVDDVEPRTEEEVEEEPKYLSDTSKEDCLFCGDGKGTLLPLYRGEENIGVISLNTFELAHIEINRYDDHGKLIKEPLQGTSMGRTSTGEGGFTFMSTEDTNRGYAMCDLYFNNDEILDIEKAANYLCTECLNRVVDDGWGEDPTGMAMVNFATGQVRILRENLLAFQFGDFYVSCDAKRNKEDSLEMDLLIFYCPKRYGD